MNSYFRRVLLFSFILSILVTLLVYMYIGKLGSKKETQQLVKVLVANTNIPKGTVIEKKMLREIELPKESIQQGYIRDYSLVLGKFAKENIIKDEIILLGKLQGEKIDELSFNIDENYRALSVNVTGDTGVSYLLKPGDYVDVIVFLSEKRENNRVVRRDIAKVILQNIKVLAVDRNMTRQNNPKDDGKVPTRFFVTLQVPAQDVEKLVLAEDIGKIKLSLRANKSTDTINSNGTVEADFFINKEEKYIYYKVKKGDTLRNISRAFYGHPDNYDLLKEINNIKDENIIVPNMIIKIPVSKK
ncbi:Flp pilus assembly protein CpaB [Caloramator proteoclasticus]|uniref:Pilus assembly protein CpaB n=1 Tax=Caloramator proteoclasticus DSM 10124 TaxID=1121262 RepID=A0A1M4ZWZ0_9CLOT|nr:Flp pilus assembly protein CpaB [Caloramator proteoclasticus]SHF22543.1 pilus assembly protein CpaB [Caloramator proteoclasticus DSM 10124]